jgi:hypothetical protein
MRIRIFRCERLPRIGANLLSGSWWIDWQLDIPSIF